MKLQKFEEYRILKQMNESWLDLPDLSGPKPRLWIAHCLQRSRAQGPAECHLQAKVLQTVPISLLDYGQNDNYGVLPRTCLLRLGIQGALSTLAAMFFSWTQSVSGSNFLVLVLLIVRCFAGNLKPLLPWPNVTSKPSYMKDSTSTRN